MADRNIAVRHIQRNDTRANWLLSNPVLSLGELGIENDTFKIKIGNGIDNYANLPYLNSSTVSKISTQKVVATVDGQAEFIVPFDDFDSSNCYLDVRINSVWINPDKYTIQGNKIILNSGRKSGTEVFFTCHYLENHASNDASVVSHTHTVSEITDFPQSLPANGGNADTLEGKHASDFSLVNHSHNYLPLNGGVINSESTSNPILTLSQNNQYMGVGINSSGLVTFGESKATGEWQNIQDLSFKFNGSVQFAGSVMNSSYQTFAVAEYSSVTPMNGWSNYSFGSLDGGEKPFQIAKVGKVLIITGCLYIGTCTKNTIVATTNFRLDNDVVFPVQGIYSTYGIYNVGYFRFTKAGSIVVQHDAHISKMSQSTDYVVVNAVVVTK